MLAAYGGKLPLLLCAICLLTAAARADTVVGVFDNNSPAHIVNGFGTGPEVDSNAVGEEFTSPGGSIYGVGISFANVKGYLATFTFATFDLATDTIGPALYIANDVGIDDSSFDFFWLPSIATQQGATYAAYVTAIDPASNPYAVTSADFNGYYKYEENPVYTGGALLPFGLGNPTQAPVHPLTLFDLDFAAFFHPAPPAPTAVTPEPSGISLLALGLLGAFSAFRRRVA